MSEVKELVKEDFEKEVLESEIPVLVDFWAPWCQPCIMMSPVLDEVAEEWSGKVKIVKLNVSEPENQEIATRYDIQAIPNMKVFEGGNIIKEIIGLQTKESLEENLKNIS